MRRQTIRSGCGDAVHFGVRGPLLTDVLTPMDVRDSALAFERIIGVVYPPIRSTGKPTGPTDRLRDVR